MRKSSRKGCRWTAPQPGFFSWVGRSNSRRRKGQEGQLRGSSSPLATSVAHEQQKLHTSLPPCEETDLRAALAVHRQLTPLHIALLPTSLPPPKEAGSCVAPARHEQLTPHVASAPVSRRGYRGAGAMEGCRPCTVGHLPLHGYGPTGGYPWISDLLKRQPSPS